MPKTAAIILVFTALVLTSCPGEDGVVVLDVCTPAEAADPFLNGRTLRVSSVGDVSSSKTFDLVSSDYYEHLGSYPMGSNISLVVEVLNAGDVAVARGNTEVVEVRPVTRVCACLTLLIEAEMELCRDIGCVYEPDTDRCVFYRLY